MISRLKTILILGSQTLETFMVSTISEVPVDHLVRRKLGISYKCRSFVKIQSTEFLPELWPFEADKQQRTRAATWIIKVSIKKGFNMLVADKAAPFLGYALLTEVNNLLFLLFLYHSKSKVSRGYTIVNSWKGW